MAGFKTHMNPDHRNGINTLHFDFKDLHPEITSDFLCSGQQEMLSTSDYAHFIDTAIIIIT